MQKKLIPQPAKHKTPLCTILKPDSAFITRYYVWRYNSLPHRIEFSFSVKNNELLEFLQNDYDLTSDFYYSREYGEGNYSPVCEGEQWVGMLKEGLMMSIDKYRVVLAHHDLITKHEIENLISIIHQFRSNDKIKKNREFGMVVRSEYGGFEISNFEVSDSFPSDLNTHYNDDLVEMNSRLIEFINDPKKGGLVLLHGNAGTGKTSYLRYLIQQTKTEFLYLPQDVFNNMSDPAFIPFIARQKGAVVVLEDCEELLKPREQSHMPVGVSNLLNLADGLLGDALKLKIICTFNTELNNIDSALLRKGRLFQRYEFKPLSTEKTNRLLRKQAGDVQAVNGMTLAEIFNYNIENNSDYSDAKGRKIGY
jgi:ATPase family associated with various cellular activities (AAA)